MSADTLSLRERIAQAFKAANWTDRAIKEACKIVLPIVDGKVLQLTEQLRVWKHFSAEKDAQIAMLAKAAPQAAELLIELRDKEAQIAALLDVFQHEQAAYEESQRAHALAGKRKSSDECGAIAAALRFAAEEVSKRIASWRETPAPPQEPETK